LPGGLVGRSPAPGPLLVKTSASENPCAGAQQRSGALVDLQYRAVRVARLAAPRCSRSRHSCAVARAGFAQPRPAGARADCCAAGRAPDRGWRRRSARCRARTRSGADWAAGGPGRRAGSSKLRRGVCLSTATAYRAGDRGDVLLGARHVFDATTARGDPRSTWNGRTSKTAALSVLADGAGVRGAAAAPWRAGGWRRRPPPRDLGRGGPRTEKARPRAAVSGAGDALRRGDDRPCPSARRHGCAAKSRPTWSVCRCEGRDDAPSLEAETSPMAGSRPARSRRGRRLRDWCPCGAPLLRGDRIDAGGRATTRPDTRGVPPGLATARTAAAASCPIATRFAADLGGVNYRPELPNPGPGAPP
jgi:hypothetical protein